MHTIKRKKKLPFHRLLWPLALAICMIGFIDLPADEGAAICAECHEDLAAAFNGSAHAVIDAKGLASWAGAKFSCESCHGDTAKHLEEAEAGNIFAFKGTETANSKSKMCLACHKTEHAEYLSGPHGKASMDCTSCHAIHKKTKQTLLKAGPTKVCYSCHEDVFAKFRLNERHRLFEGILGCGSCHDPHKPAAMRIAPRLVVCFGVVG